MPAWSPDDPPPFLPPSPDPEPGEDDHFTNCEECGDSITVDDFNRSGTSEHCDNCIGNEREDGSIVGEDD